MLIVCPVSQRHDDGREDRERNGDDDDQRAAPVAQEEQDHQSGQQRAEQRLPDQAVQGARSRNATDRTSKLDLDVVGQRRSCMRRQRLACTLANHVQRRRVGALGHRDVDGALAVDVRDSRRRCRWCRVIGADVAQVDGRAGARCGSARRAAPGCCRRASHWWRRCGIRSPVRTLPDGHHRRCRGSRRRSLRRARGGTGAAFRDRPAPRSCAGCRRTAAAPRRRAAWRTAAARD